MKVVNQTMNTGKAFTLIELLIVVAIIGILAAIAVPNFLNAQVRAKLAQARGDMRALATAVEMYGIDHGAYPCDGQEPDCLWNWTWQNWRLTSPVAYIASIPTDPYVEEEDSASGHYWYTTKEGYGGQRAPGRPSSVRGRDNVRLYDPPRSQFGYGYISLGPDREWEWDRLNRGDPLFAGDVLYYDPSNGTISQGDLYMFGPGNAFNPPSTF